MIYTTMIHKMDLLLYSSALHQHTDDNARGTDVAMLRVNFMIATLAYNGRQVMAKVHIAFMKKNHNHRVQLWGGEITILVHFASAVYKKHCDKVQEIP